MSLPNQAEQKQAEQPYRSVVELAPDSVVTVDMKGVITSSNTAATGILGYSKDELIGKHFSKLGAFRARDIPKLLRLFKSALRGELAEPLELTLYRKDGTPLLTEVRVGVLKEGGKPIGLQAVTRDITERVRAEEALRKSEERYKKQFEEAMDAIFIADAETGIIVDCNRVASELVGREKSELVGKHQRILHPPEEIEGEFSRTFKQHLKEKEGQVLETQVITKKGEIKDVAIKASTFDLEGQKMILGIFRDITERKQAEEALAHERNLLHALVDNIPDYIYFKDRESRFIRTTKAHAKTFGLSDPTEAIGKTDFDFFSDEHARQAYEDEQEVIRTGEPLLNVEERETWPDRPDTWVLTSKMPLRDAEGNIIGTFGISKDITERKQAEEEIRRRSEELTVLNTIGMAVTGTLDLQEVLQTIQKRTRKLLGEKYGPVFALFNEADQTLDLTLTYLQEDVVRRVDRLIGMKFEELSLPLSSLKPELGEVLLAGRPYVANDVRDFFTRRTSRRLFKGAQIAMGVKCIVALPLCTKGKLVGTMLLFSQKEKILEEDMELLSGVANQAVIAIENARLYERSQSDFANLSRLFEASSRIGSTLDLGETLQFITQAAVEATDGHSATLILAHPGGEAEMKATVNHGDELRGATEPRAAGVTAKVVQTGEAVIIPNVPEAKEWVNPGMIEAGFGAAACFPLRLATSTLGAMWVNWSQPRHFLEREVDLLQTFANEAAIAIENARLYEDTKSRLAQLTALQETSRAVASTLELEKLLNLITHQATTLLQGEGGILNLVDWEKKEEEVVTASGSVAAALAWRSPLEGSLSGWVILHNQPVISNQLQNDSRVDPRVRSGELGVQTAAIAPLTIKDQVIGTLVVQDKQRGEGEFDQTDLDLLVAFANQAATAIENARLYQETKRLAGTDPLTGVWNRRHIEERLRSEVARTRRFGHEFSVLVMDIDNLKLFNDTYGHPAGDEVIRTVAQVVLSSCREIDVLGRYGGDEFALLLPETGPQGAAMVAERILTTLEKEPFQAPDGTKVPMSISIGAASYPSDSEEPDRLFSLADAAMYRVKVAGGGQFASLTVGPEEVAEELAAHFDVLQGLLIAVDSKDRYTFKHSQEVTERACALARAVGLSKEETSALEVAGRLHDIGKIGIPTSILRKPGPLTPEEWRIVQEHPRLGYLILQQLPQMETVLQALLHHHERYDGKGYPSGLQDEKIPLLSRILAVSDAFSAMTSDRPYRKALTVQEAVDELRRNAGKQFDPHLAQKFIQLVEEGEIE